MGRSLKTRLILGFLALAIPSVAIMGAISLYALRELTTANRDLHEISRSLEAVRALEAGVGRALMPVSEFVAYGGPEQRPVFEARMIELDLQLRSCGNSACHGASARPAEMAQSLVPSLHSIRQRASEVFDESTNPADRLRLFRQITEGGDSVDRQLERMASALLARVAALQEASQNHYERAWQLVLAAVASVAGLALLIAYFMSRQLARPILQLVSGTRHLAQGHLGYRVAVSETGDIGELARSFNAMAQEIGEHRAGLESLVQARTAELERARDSLVRSEKLASIGVLAAGVAHELNNPLTSILMNINLLMEDVRDRPEIHRDLKRVSDDAVRCQRIIEDLRDFSRRRPLQIAPCDLNEMVAEVLDATNRQLRLQGIALTRDLGDDIPAFACDAAHLRQALINVLVNAIQAMPTGGTLGVRTAASDRHATIAVTDTGPGIPGDIRSKVFDPFFTTKPEGTGLGLSIVHGIMEEHGGRIEIESPVAGCEGCCRGTAVRLWLPIEPSLEAASGSMRAAPSHV